MNKLLAILLILASVFLYCQSIPIQPIEVSIHWDDCNFGSNQVFLKYWTQVIVHYQELIISSDGNCHPMTITVFPNKNYTFQVIEFTDSGSDQEQSGTISKSFAAPHIAGRVRSYTMP